MTSSRTSGELAFITFETEEMADKAVVNAKQKIGDKEVCNS